MRAFKFRFLLMLLVFSFGSLAGVNLKNGNFYISYTDIIVPGGGKDLEITRTYNSNQQRRAGLVLAGVLIMKLT